MHFVGVLWFVLITRSSGALETGDALRNRGRGLDSLVDMQVERKFTRRTRKRATQQLVSKEPVRNEVQDGTGVVTSDSANAEANVVEALQVSSQPAARRTHEQNLTSSSFAEHVASAGARFSTEDDDAITSLDREKYAQQRKRRVKTLRGHHRVRQPITIFGEELVGHNATVICRKGNRLGVRVGGDSSGLPAHATVDKTTHVKGLTIEECKVLSLIHI